VLGTVVNSVVGPGAVVGRGAEVRHSAVMTDAVVQSGAVVGKSALGEGVVVGRGAHVGSLHATRPVLVGAHHPIPGGGEIASGTHLSPSAPHKLVRRRA
jgi:glucose-1-phosphate adenylyltransferase